MDATTPTTDTNSSVSTQSQSPFHFLEISLISAQDLTPIHKSMRTYAVAWTNPSRKLHTHTDHHGHTHPKWNEKLTFRVDSHFLSSKDSSLHVEIFTASWLREVLVGTVQVLISDLLPPPPTPTEDPPQPRTIRFLTLQIRSPSGDPHGMLNVGAALLDKPTRNTGDEEMEINKANEHGPEENEKKVHLWRSMSVGSDAYSGSGYNPNGSELCSDIGPSASVVAADLAQKWQQQPPQQEEEEVVVVRRPNGYEDNGSSIIGEMTMEEAEAKGYRVRPSKEKWRKQDYDDDDDDERSDLSTDSKRNGRRKSDGGMFSCFGTAYGIEFRIVCGAPTNNSSGSKNKASSSTSRSTSRKTGGKPSVTNSA